MRPARPSPRVLVELAGACARAGRAKDGLGVLDEAQTLIAESGEGYYTAELHRLRGELLLMGGRGEGGSTEHLRAIEACFQQAIEIARGQGTRSWELRAAMSLCRLWRSQGETERARDLLSEVYGRFTAGFDTPDLRQAKALLDALA